MVFVETIANPRTQVADLEGIGSCAPARHRLHRRQHADHAATCSAQGRRAATRS
jgi:hypothetical protein